MAIIRRIIKILACVTYLVIFAYLLILAPQLMGYKPIVVLSGSMEPTYKTGGVIYYKPVSSPSELKVNDVITFQFDNAAFVTHRIVGFYNDDEYITKGDNNNSEDTRSVKFSEVQGKVADKYLPYVGFFVNYVNSHYEIILIFLIESSSVSST